MPGTGTSMKNGYSIVDLRIEKGIFNNFTPILHESKEKSELKLPPFSAKTRIFSEILHPFRVKFTPFFKSNQIKLKLNIFILNRYGPHYTIR